MKFAQIFLSDDTECIWTGSLLNFLRTNAYTLEDTKEIIKQLRGPEGHTLLGGGAAPVFQIQLTRGAS